MFVAVFGFQYSIIDTNEKLAYIWSDAIGLFGQFHAMETTELSFQKDNYPGNRIHAHQITTRNTKKVYKVIIIRYSHSLKLSLVTLI